MGRAFHLMVWAFHFRLTISFLLVAPVASFARWKHASASRPSFSLVGSAVATTSEVTPSCHGTTLSLFSPCKINLFLRILRKREDGYHDIASLFQAIGFGDTLELTVLNNAATEDAFTCNMPGVPLDSSNLVIRALQLMRDKTGVQQFYQTNLIKQVPAQAGLGGGSANAATALWGANELMGRPATLEQVRLFVGHGCCILGVV
jgi:4-diphosphocytidyl-2-C-methyl-D-erythritol kinase